MEMDKSLSYLREILSNYTGEHSHGRNIYQKLSAGHFASEESFVRNLKSSEIRFLNKILPKEINYAKDEQDSERAKHLNEVYELLY